MKKSLLILFFTSVVFSQSILGTWQLQEQYKNNEVVTFKSYLKYEFSPPNVWRSFVGDYIDYGYFITKEQSIVLKFDDCFWWRCGEEIDDEVCLSLWKQK